MRRPAASRTRTGKGGLRTPSPGERFALRRERFKEAIRDAASGRPAMALIFSGEDRGLRTFRPDAGFYYLTGVQSPDSLYFLAVSPARDTEVLLLPATDPTKERWTGKVLSAGSFTEACEPDARRQEAARLTGLPLIGTFQQIEEILARPLHEAEIVFLNLPDDSPPGQVGPVQHLAQRLAASHPHLRFYHAGKLVAALRRVKDPGELALMREAMAITDHAHEAILRHLRPGMAEYQVQALVEYAFTSLGAQSTAFPSIVGSGPNTCALHYDKNRRVMSRGDLVVCDIGCRKDLYCADVTRTYPVSGRFTRRQRSVYDVVLRSQEAALAAAAPGVLIKDVHRAAVEVMAGAGLAPYFFHGTSHYLGLEPHDAGSNEVPLEPGVVITIEPGAYIASEELGVRVEDDVLITPQGAERMTHAPRDPGEIEKALARPRRTVIL